MRQGNGNLSKSQIDICIGSVHINRPSSFRNLFFRRIIPYHLTRDNIYPRLFNVYRPFPVFPAWVNHIFVLVNLRFENTRRVEKE